MGRKQVIRKKINMTHKEQERYFLIDCFSRDGYFYIQRKENLLVTDDSDIKIGSKVQFIYNEEKEVRKEEPKINKENKIRIGKIIMESGNFYYFLHLYS